MACAVCMGAADAKTGPAINGAIFLMLACIGSVLSLIVAVAWSIFRHSRRYSAEQSALNGLTLDNI